MQANIKTTWKIVNQFSQTIKTTNHPEDESDKKFSDKYMCPAKSPKSSGTNIIWNCKTSGTNIIWSPETFGTNLIWNPETSSTNIIWNPETSKIIPLLAQACAVDSPREVQWRGLQHCQCSLKKITMKKLSLMIEVDHNVSTLPMLTVITIVNEIVTTVI